MAARKSPTPEVTADREIVISRILDAPRDLVFAAWTDPDQIVKWWGPDGFTTTNHTMDVRPGGTWKLTMHSPDGTDYPNTIVYLEIVKPDRIVYKHGRGKGGKSGASFTTTATFEPVAGRTKLTMRMVFATAEARDLVVREHGAIEGGNQTIGRLATYLDTLPTHELVITRVFDAPRDLVFKTWTDPAHAKHWWGPREYPASELEMDARPGGMWRARLKSTAGEKDLWHSGVFREVVAPERIVFTFAWDEMGERGLETVVTVTLKEQGRKTHMTFHQAPFRSSGVCEGHEGGWGSCFDRLAEKLAKQCEAA